MEITKEGAQSLRMKMRNVELYLNEAIQLFTTFTSQHNSNNNIYLYQKKEIQPRLAATLKKLECAHLLDSKHRSKLSTVLITRWVSNDTKFVQAHFAEMTGDRYTKQASVTALHVSVV